MEEDNKIQDPTEIGVLGLKGIRSVDNPPLRTSDRLALEGYEDVAEMFSTPYKQRMLLGLLQGDPFQELGFVGINDSSYDLDIISINQLRDIENTRGELLPWYSLLGAGAAKMGILAATTFANATLGTLWGVGTAIANSDISGLWDNDITKALNNVNEASEEVFKNYYTREEQESPWYDNIFTANFWGDKVLKNMGFTIGSIGAGAVTGGLVNPLLSGIKGGAVLSRALTTAVSSAAEASIEASNAAKDLFDGELTNIDAYYNLLKELTDLDFISKYNAILNKPVKFSNVGIEGLRYVSDRELEIDNLKKLYQERIDNIESNRELAINKASLDRVKTGNFTFALNNILLSLSNNLQFGRLLSGGYNNTKRGASLLMRDSNNNPITGTTEAVKALMKGDLLFAANEGFKTLVVKNVVKDVVSESFEEAALLLIQTTPRIRFSSELNSYMGAKINPDALENIDNYINAASQALTELFGDISSEGWENAFLGGIGGLLGVPLLKRSSTGKLKLLGAGGVWDAYEEAKDEYKSNDYVEKINDIISAPNFVNRYLGLIARDHYQTLMDLALNEGDKFEYKNSEFALLFTDVMTFRNANLLDVYKEFLNSFNNLGISDALDIRKSGSFVNSEGVENNIYEGLTDELIINNVKDKALKISNKVGNILLDYNNLFLAYGDVYDADDIAELAFENSVLKDLNSRASDILENYRNTIYKTLSNDIKSKEVDINDLKFTIDQIVSNQELFLLALSKPHFLKLVNESINNYNDPVIANTVSKDILDLKKIENLSKSMRDRLVNHLNNPESIKLTNQQVIDLATLKKALLIFDNALNKSNLVQNINEFRSVVSDLPPEMMTSLYNIISLSDNSLLKNIANIYRDLLQSLSDIMKIYDDLPNKTPLAKSVIETIYNLSEDKQDLLSKLTQESINPEAPLEVKDVLSNLLEKIKGAESIRLTSSLDIRPLNKKPKKSKLSKMKDLFSKADEIKPDAELLELLRSPKKSEEVSLDTLELEKKDVKTELNLEDTLSLVDLVELGDEEAIKKFDSVNPPVHESLEIDTPIELDIINTDTIEGDAGFTNDAFTRYNINALITDKKLVLNDNPLVNKLIELGAYDFVDSGKLGDIYKRFPKTEIKYIISNLDSLNRVVLLSIEATDKLRKVVGSFTNLILASDGKLYQIVGALKGTNEALLTKTETILKNILLERSELDSTYYVSGLYSNYIKHIYSGRIYKSTDSLEGSLKTLSNLTDINNVRLGIYYSPTLFVTTVDDYITPNIYNSNPREGSIFFMDKGADAVFYPKSLHIVRFNKSEYPISMYLDTPVILSLKKDLRGLLQLNESSILKEGFKYRDNIENTLYFGNPLDATSPRILFNANRISIVRDNNILFETALSIPDADIPATVDKMLDVLLDLNLRFQIKASDTVYKDRLKLLYDSDILLADFLIGNKNASFQLYDNDLLTGKPVVDYRNDTPNISTNRNIKNTIDRETFILGNKYYYVSDNTILDENNKLVSSLEIIDKLNLIRLIKNGDIKPITNTVFRGVNSLNEPFYLLLLKSGGFRSYKKLTGDLLYSLLKAKLELINRKPHLELQLALLSNTLLLETNETPTKILNSMINRELAVDLVKLTKVIPVTDNYVPNNFNLSTNTPIFDKLIKTNLRAIREINNSIKSILLFKEYALSKGIDIYTINSLELFNTMLETLKHCR